MRRSKKYTPKEERNEDIPVNKVLSKIHSVCFDITSISDVDVSFEYISQSDEDFTIRFISSKGIFTTTMSTDSILAASLEELSKCFEKSTLLDSKTVICELKEVDGSDETTLIDSVNVCSKFDNQKNHKISKETINE